MKRNVILLAGCALALGLIVPGCGDDDDNGEDGTTATAAALPKQQFIAEADALCNREDRELDQAAQALGKNPSDAELEGFVTDSAVPNVQGQIDGIRDIGTPQGAEDQLTTFLDTAQAALDRVEADPSLFTDQGGADPFAETRQLARDFGFRQCAQ